MYFLLDSERRFFECLFVCFLVVVDVVFKSIVICSSESSGKEQIIILHILGLGFLLQYV